MKTRIVPGDKLPLAGNYKDEKFQWLWEGKWITASLVDVVIYIERHKCVPQFLKDTINHIVKNDDGLYPPPRWQGGEKPKQFLKETLVDKVSLQKACANHQMKYKVNIL